VSRTRCSGSTRPMRMPGRSRRPETPVAVSLVCRRPRRRSTGPGHPGPDHRMAAPLSVPHRNDAVHRVPLHGERSGQRYRPGPEPDPRGTGLSRARCRPLPDRARARPPCRGRRYRWPGPPRPCSIRREACPPPSPRCPGPAPCSRPPPGH
jgi:hypothetical protein